VMALVPTVAAVAGQVAAGVVDWPVPVRVVRGAAARYAAFAVARAAIAASGSVTLELAAAGLPMIVTYRSGRLTAFVARRAVRTPWAGLVNILAGEGAVPELLQERCTPGLLAAALDPLIDDGPRRSAQQGVLARVMARLHDVPEPPSRAAARVVLDTIKRRE
ncbi:MAG: lipid-A-disaccharide synthase, partial [Alphaproteobacteria bacterium]